MSAPSKAAAERRGYRRALRDVEAEMDRLFAAGDILREHVGVDEAKWLAVRRVLARVRFHVLPPLRNKEGIDP